VQRHPVLADPDKNAVPKDETRAGNAVMMPEPGRLVDQRVRFTVTLSSVFSGNRYGMGVFFLITK
jgi:hypothetical protein